ncbi:MAG: hypothetical protein Q7V15_15510 [Phenylobacterium sp.]|uniref:VOC family protein n=1 Tax=Phenylobacterium sp. TaxID=1871053 RepID=UPI0027223ECC|nr:VOC family protein [Phenylobacterium sp.]MDO8902752.1 hypothetical protein [Phenylobacterium sp.]
MDAAQLTATPIYRDPRQALDWLEAAFGFEVTTLLTDEQGGVAHAEMGFHGARIGVAGPWSGGPLGPARLVSPAALDGQATQLCWLALPPSLDLDAHCAQARAAGAEITQAPEDQFYGARTYRALDLDGHVWCFSQAQRTVPVAEMEAATGLKVEKVSEGDARTTEAPRSAVTPYISYADPAAAYLWLETAFGLEPRVYVTDGAGALVHAEMAFGGQTIGVAKAWSDRHAVPGDVGGRNTQSVHLQMESDIDAHHAAAVSAGAQIIRPLETQPYGDRSYIALDLEGHIWSFGQTVAPMSIADWDEKLGTRTRLRPTENR